MHTTLSQIKDESNSLSFQRDPSKFDKYRARREAQESTIANTLLKLNIIFFGHSSSM
jgi:hypothetical protein